MVSPSGILLLNETENYCHGASPSVITSRVSYIACLLLKGGSWLQGSIEAQIWSRSLMLPADICSHQKRRSASSNEVQFLEGKKSVGGG